jgi:galactose-1-phosphate uridylyltransferase
MSNEAMKMALAKFEHLWEIGIDAEYKVELLPEIQTLRQAIEQEPVNTMPTKIVGPNLEQILNAAGFYKREWVGLTDAELAEFSNMKLGAYDLCLEVEDKLKEKNT